MNLACRRRQSFSSAVVSTSMLRHSVRSGGINRRLDLAGPVDEDLHVVQPAEDVLAALEGSKIVRRTCAGCFDGDFERVSKFLERDTNGMQPLWQI